VRASMFPKDPGPRFLVSNQYQKSPGALHKQHAYSVIWWCTIHGYTISMAASVLGVMGQCGLHVLLRQGFMNWNAVRHVPGSSSQPNADTIKVIMDQRGRFKSMVMIINAGCDQMFWQLRIAADKPDFTTEKPGGAGIPGSKERVLQRLKEHGWEDAVKVRPL